MRFKLILCGALLPPALLLAGCGMSTVSSLSPDLESPALSGRSFGGQYPITGATVFVIAMGTSGYGSQGAILATTTTDSGGGFNFAPGAYTCPQPNTPVYVMGIGGNPGLSAGTNNPVAVTAAGLGSCTAAQSSGVVMNEVTTAALAFSLAHFFTTAIGATSIYPNNGDWFGGPSPDGGTTPSRGLVLANSYTIPALVNTATGTANQPSTGYVVDNQKIYSIANILAACINTDGSTAKKSAPCAELFKDTTTPSGAVPTDTLQAAVVMALYPSQDVAKLFDTIPSAPAFGGGLSAVPNDWTIGISYTTSSLGLGVDTGTASTLDIDSNGNVWFPSNLAGATGAAYFDQASRTFNGPFNSTGLLHPQQVAIDTSGYVWYNDSASSAVSSYLDSSPGSTQSLSLAGTDSNALTIGYDGRVNVGTTKGSTYGLAIIAADRSSYTAQTPTFGLPVTSVAGDNTGDVGVSTTNAAETQFTDYIAAGNIAGQVVTSKKDDSGQVIFTGNDFIATRPYSGTGNANDGICIFSQGACFALKGGTKSAPIGLAIDGAASLWLADFGDNSVLEVPVANTSATNGAAYLNSGSKAAFNEYLHGPDSGPTTTMTAPYGIGIDAAGNVWVSNAGCTTTACTPGSFTLSEIVGAATPTITPVSAQIAGGANLVGKPPTN